MMDGIWKVFSSRMRLDTAMIPLRTSKHGTSLRCSSAGRRRWEMTNLSDSASAARTCGCSSTENDVMSRSTALWALVALRVASTMCPVSAAVRARLTVSLSRRSPMTMTSGSSRSAARRARENELVLVPTSRWLMRQFLNG